MKTKQNSVKRERELITSAYTKTAVDRQISVLKISNVFSDAHKALLNVPAADWPATLEGIMPGLVEKYCEPKAA